MARAALTMIVTAAGMALLSGCQAYVPRDETPVLPAGFSTPEATGPSSQRLGRDGYPLIGAYPKAATTQAEPAVVAAEQARFANVAARGTRSNPGGYQASVAELGALAAQRNAIAARARTQGGRSADELRALAAERRERSGR